MCVDPVTALIVASTAVGAAGDIVEGQQQKALADLEAANYNAQAIAERRTSGYEIARERTRQIYADAERRAQVGASGVALTGSPVEVLNEQAAQDELELRAIQYGSTLRQQSLRTQAQVSRAQGRMAVGNSFLSASSRILSAGAKAFGAPGRSVRASSPFVQRTPVVEWPRGYDG